jgi:hypothetical protein
VIKLFKIIGGSGATPTSWTIGQFENERHALDEYNSEVRRSHSEKIEDGRPELEFVKGLGREVEYYLTEEEVTHTQYKRDEAFESGRWGLARKAYLHTNNR